MIAVKSVLLAVILIGAFTIRLLKYRKKWCQKPAASAAAPVKEGQ